MDIGHVEFEVLSTPTEWVKVHALQKFLQLSVDPHTSWNLLNYYLTLAIEYWLAGLHVMSFSVMTPDNDCNSIPPVSTQYARSWVA